MKGLSSGGARPRILGARVLPLTLNRGGAAQALVVQDRFQYQLREALLGAIKGRLEHVGDRRFIDVEGVAPDHRLVTREGRQRQQEAPPRDERRRNRPIASKARTKEWLVVYQCAAESSGMSAPGEA